MEIIKKSISTGLLAIAFLSCLIIFSCRSGSKKASEKVMENAIENATGKDAKVDLNNEKTVIESGGNRIVVDGKANTWPSEIPGDVPEFKFGRIEAVTTSNVDGSNVWTIAFKEVQDGFLDKYDAQLKAIGFETVIIKAGDKGGSIMGETKKFTVYLMGGEGTVSISVSTKKPE
jgi:hypothetical protein